MKINTEILYMLATELKDVCFALQQGVVIEELDPSDGWVEVEQINPALPRSSYRIVHGRQRQLARLWSPNK